LLQFPLDNRTEGEDGGEDSYKLTMLDKVLVSIVWVMGLVNTLLSEYIVSKNPHTLCSIRDGTPTKRQVSKRQVSKCLVSKRPVSKRQADKMSGFQNVRFIKCQVYKRQVSKRQVSKRLVSKRLVSKRQADKMSGFQNVRFQNVWFQNVQFLNFIYLLNKKYRNCQVCTPI
jgi:hypothetical protein